MTELDAVDRALLRELQNNGRLPNKELAAAVGIAPSTALERVRGLRSRGILTGFRADVDLAALGRTLQAILAIRVRPHSRSVVEPFVDYVLGLPESLEVFHVAGSDDFLLRVAVRDAEHLQRLLLDSFTTRPEVAHIHTSLIFAHHTKPVIEPL